MLRSGGTAATAAALTPTQLISGKAFAADPVAVSAESFATLAEMEPWYAKAEDKMDTTGTNGIPRLPGNNNYKVLEAGAKKLGYKEVYAGNMSINSEPRNGRGSCLQIGLAR